MRVLITGSSGQIGTNLALALQARGDQVVGIDRRPNAWTDRIETCPIDLNTASEKDYPTGPFDLVVHLAAYAKVFELVEHPGRALENVTMCFNVLDYARKHRLPLIFGSSREVYGDIHRHVTEEAEADFVVAESPYSASKISGEAFIYSYAQCYGLRYLVFRFSNVYGRYDNDIERMERVIPLFIRKIKNGDPITIFGKKKVLDFTYVDDCVGGICKGIDLLVNEQDGNQTINLAFGQGNTLTNMAKYIGEALSVEPDIHFEEPRVGEVTHYVANIGKAHALLGYTPSTPLREGIHKAVAWGEDWQSRQRDA